MKFRLLFLSILAAASQATAQNTTDFSQCPNYFAKGEPPIIPSVQAWRPRALCFNAFAVLHSGQSRTPLFVAERLSRAQLADARGEQRTDRFYAEARLPSSDRAELTDYQHSGMDRGHMASAADQPSSEAMAQSFSLANIVPQSPVNNRTVWAGVEKSTRKYAMRSQSDIYVITGPVFTAASRHIGKNNVRVPTYLYKLVYDPSSNRAWAHWVENIDTAEAGPPISYAELVKRTGINFFPNIRPLE